LARKLPRQLGSLGPVKKALCALAIFCYDSRIMEYKHSKVHSEYTASSKADLIAYLKKQDITTQPETKRDMKIYDERQAGFRLLATWANANYFSYPLKLVHWDRPDFLLSYDGTKIGIERSRAASENYLAVDDMAEREGAEGQIFMDNFQPGMPKLSTSERREIYRDQRRGAGWGNKGQERDWVEWMVRVLLKKTEDFNKPDFKKYDKNWLLIHEHESLFVRPVKLESAMELLIKELSRYWAKKVRYDKLLIETVNRLVEICPSVWNQWPIIDLWV